MMACFNNIHCTTGNLETDDFFSSPQSEAFPLRVNRPADPQIRHIDGIKLWVILVKQKVQEDLIFTLLLIL